MKSIRKGVFETNSSSTHVLVLCKGSEYTKWINNQMFVGYVQGPVGSLNYRLYSEDVVRDMVERSGVPMKMFQDDAYHKCDSSTLKHTKDGVSFGFYDDNMCFKECDHLTPLELAAYHIFGYRSKRVTKEQAYSYDMGGIEDYFDTVRIFDKGNTDTENDTVIFGWYSTGC